MSSPQLLEGEDIATGLRDCSAAMLAQMRDSALLAFLAGGDALEVELGHRRQQGDVTLLAAPALFLEALLVEMLRRCGPDLATAVEFSGTLAEWRELRARLADGD